MANTDNPYLCGGTFLAQILRARKSSELSAYYNRNKKESLSEQETFRRLISIYHIAEFSSCSSLKTYTSQFKSCTNSLESFALFSDSDVKREFDSDVRSADSSALTMMSDFVQEFIDTEKYIQLVRCLLDMIENDSTIAPNTPLYILENTESVTKAEINNMQIFMIEPFLLGIWHYIIMNRSDSNEKGASTYRQWYPSRDKYIGTVGSGTRIFIHGTLVMVPYIHLLKQPVVFPAHNGGVVRLAKTAPSILVVKPDEPLPETAVFPTILLQIVLERAIHIVFEGQLRFFRFDRHTRERFDMHQARISLDHEKGQNHYRTNKQYLM